MGPLWVWSTFPFEDGIRYFKRYIHGPNKKDIELLNTMEIVNASYTLREKLDIINQNITGNYTVCGKGLIMKVKEAEMKAVSLISYNFIGKEKNKLRIYKRAQKQEEIFTSLLYLRQKKRCNCIVSWNELSIFGAIKYFIKKDSEIFAVI